MAIDAGLPIRFDPAFPVAGLEQGSQQFRDNFETIRFAIENLQSVTSSANSIVEMTTAVSVDGRVVARFRHANNALGLPVGAPSVDPVEGMVRYQDGAIAVYDGRTWAQCDPLRRLDYDFSASAVWSIEHGLGRYPASIVAYDQAGNQLDVMVSNPTPNRTIITLAEPMTGSVVVLG